MTHFTSLQFVAFALNLFVWTYVFAQRKRDPVNKAFLYFAGAITAWVFLDMHMSWPISEATAFRVMKIKSIVYLPVGVLFLRFVFALVGRSRFDRHALRAFVAILLLGQTIAVLTPYLEADLVKAWWGWTETTGPLFMPITICVIVSPLVYGLVKAVRAAYSIDVSVYDRRIIRWVVQGTAAALVIGVVTDIVLPAAAGTLTEIPDFAALSTSLISLHVFVAVTKHNLMATGVEQVAGLMFDHSADATVAVDNRGAVTVMNDAANKLFGRGMPVSASDLIAGYGGYADNEAHDVRLRIRDDMRILSMTKTPNVRSGVQLGTTAIIRDVTANRRAEDALRQSEQLYRTLIDSAPDPILMVNRSGIVLSANKGVADLAGRPQDQLVGRGLKDLWPEEIAKKTMESVIEVFEMGEIASVEGPFPTEAGQKWFRTILAPVHDSAGGVYGVVNISHDLTERMKAEKAVREERDFSTAVFETAEAFILVLDNDGRIVRFNPYAEELTGYKSAEVEGKEWFTTFLPERDREPIKAMFSDAVNDIRTQGNINAILTRSGEERQIEWYNRTLKGAEGETIGVLAIGQDVTSRIHAQEELLESERKWRTIFGTVTDGILLADLGEMRFHESNEAMCRMLGYTESEMKLLHVPDIHPAESMLQVREAFHGMARGDEPLAPDLPVLKKDGSIFYADVNATNVELGGKQYLLGVFRDVTERRRAQQLREALARNWQTTFDAITSGIMLIDRDHTVVQCNTAAAEFIGRSQADIVGGSCFELLHCADLPLLECPVECAIKSRSRASSTLAIQGRDIEVTADPVIDETGRVTGAVHVMTDVTERKLLEDERIRAREAAEAANHLKSQFLANVSHEIRTPMNGIIGMAELALDTDLTDEQREYLEIVRGSGDALLTVINDVLDFSKMEAGKMSVASAEFDVRKTFEEAYRPLAMRAGKKGVDAVLHVSSTVPEKLVGDAGRLRQVLVNLVGNAVKFTDSGQVVVRIAAQAGRGNDAILHVAVRDTGPGIPEQRQKDLFRPFVQLDGSSTRKHGGTGLGLAICSQLAQLMGGRTWVKSEVGKGSTFHFTARCSIVEHVGPVLKSDSDQLVRLRALLFDQNGMSRRFMTTLLARWGMSTDCVEDGDAGLAMLKERRAEGSEHQFVLVDCGSSDDEGFRFVERIRSDAELTGTKVILVSASLGEGTRRRCADLAVSFLLSKPLREAALMKSIHATLEMAGPEPTERADEARYSGGEDTETLRVLVAEDNAVNQAVVGRMLERQGHLVTSAVDGKQAVEALARAEFDLVLMDVQMPVLDGFEATDHIRRGEKGTGNHIPIIAMTAHAMKGDRERCLETGMDGYIAKPIRSADLCAEVAEVLGRSRGHIVSRECEETSASPSTFDIAGLTNRCGGDEELVREVVQLFLDSSAQQLSSIKIAVDAGDYISVEREAHCLKGAASNTGAKDVAEAAFAVEHVGHSGDLEAAPRAIEALAGALAALRPEIESLLMARSQ